MPKQISEERLGRQALMLIERLTDDYPGILDGETEVNGADLIEYLTTTLAHSDIGDHIRKENADAAYLKGKP